MSAPARMSFRDLVREVLQTALRLLPWPTEPGLRKIGNPDEKSPVLVTGNYDLTVRRLMRALAGVDAWLVVAPSRGINVWCAASGGHLSTHQVVTAMKTSGIENHVAHRRATLPQFAATGVRAVEVAKRAGWSVRFGPVYAEQIPAYLAAGRRKDESMRRVHFGARERAEMAAAWASPSTLLVVLPVALWRPAWGLPLLALCWSLAMAVFFLHGRLPLWPRTSLVAGAVVVATSAVVAAGGSAPALAAAPAFALLFGGLLTADMDGSSPTRPASVLDNCTWSIELDRDACVGAFRCWEVCPEACFEKNEDERKVSLAHDDRCIRCGACVVQCPVDALYFRNDDGDRVAPDVVRRFKLNLLGKRVVGADGEDRAAEV